MNSFEKWNFAPLWLAVFSWIFGVTFHSKKWDFTPRNLENNISTDIVYISNSRLNYLNEDLVSIVIGIFLILIIIQKVSNRCAFIYYKKISLEIGRIFEKLKCLLEHCIYKYLITISLIYK